MKYLPLSVFLAIAMIAIAALVVDGGGKIQANQDVTTIAQGAARAGTNAAGGNAINGDAFRLSPGAARVAAEQYLAAAGVGGIVTVRDQRVIVTATSTYRTKLASIIGILQLPVEGTASARLIDATTN
jgi:hypothetical protein